MIRRPEVPVSDFSPTSDTQVVGIHVFAGNVAFKTCLDGIDTILDLPHHVPERDARPAGLHASGPQPCHSERDTLDAIHPVEVRVVAQNRKIVLKGERCYPGVVGRNWVG